MDLGGGALPTSTHSNPIHPVPSIPLNCWAEQTLSSQEPSRPKSLTQSLVFQGLASTMAPFCSPAPLGISPVGVWNMDPDELCEWGAQPGTWTSLVMLSIGLRSGGRLDGKSYGRGEIFLNNERRLEIPRGSWQLEEPGQAAGVQAERGEAVAEARLGRAQGLSPGLWVHEGFCQGCDIGPSLCP